MTAGAWRVRRVRPAGVTHVAVWNRPAPGGLLWERVGAARIAALRREGRAEDEIAHALAEALCPVVRDLAAELRLDALYLGGGLLAAPGLRDALAGVPLPVPLAFNADGAFVGERGGLALLREAGAEGGIVLDVGQTAIKASCLGRRLVRERDLAALPLRLIDPARKPEISPERRALVAEFVAGAVAGIAALSQPRGATLVLALPGPLDDDGTPGPCSYGWEADTDLLPETLRRIDEGLPQELVSRDVLLLNDAELAAESARADLAPPRGTRLLCVTLGFGPGAALLVADPPW